MRNGELISLVMQNGLNIETHSYLTEYVQLPQALHNEQVLYAMCLIKITHLYKMFHLPCIVERNFLPARCSSLGTYPCTVDT